MALGIERFARLGAHGAQANAARDVAAGILEMADLLGQAGLAGPHGPLEQGVDLVQDSDDDLQPLAFGPAQFVRFQAKVDPFGIIGFLQEFGKGLGFGRHALGQFGGRLNGFGRRVLDNLPLGGRVADLTGQLVEPLNLLGGVGQFLSLEQGLAVGRAAQERRDQRARAQAGAKYQAAGFPPKHWLAGLSEYKNPQGKE
jgi:hypothetical protein